MKSVEQASTEPFAGIGKNCRLSCRDAEGSRPWIYFDLLVPEIGLTPQMAGLLDQAFGQKVALLHSALTPEERSEQWRRIRSGDAPIVVGTRSAIFAPAPNLGLILVDEEHDGSYKQEETPRYNARDVAVMRAKLTGAVAVLGSATPSLESWQNAVRANTHASNCAIA